jgi:hypothetical protein
MRLRRHSPQEIAAKLHQAEELLQLGKRQAEVAHTLGISVMTYHRWRAAARAAVQSPSITPEMPVSPTRDLSERTSRLDDLEAENARLRRLVIELLLENVKLKEDFEQRRR